MYGDETAVFETALTGMSEIVIRTEPDMLIIVLSSHTPSNLHKADLYDALWSILFLISIDIFNNLVCDKLVTAVG